jgi:hydroxyquinol 1,2-dioxygenase
MSDYNQSVLTDEVIKAFGNAPTERLQVLMKTLAKHVHAFAQEVDLTPEEWLQGLQFLTKTGQISTERRPEFILLSDVMGLSMMVVSLAQARNSQSVEGATEATVEGPFYWPGAPEVALGGDIAEGVSGEPAYYTGRPVRCWTCGAAMGRAATTCSSRPIRPCGRVARSAPTNTAATASGRFARPITPFPMMVRSVT